MEAVFKSLGILFAFVLQAVFLGGLGIVFFVVPFLLLLLGMVVSLRRAPKGSWRRLLPVIVALPAIWIFVGLWAGMFWYDWAHPGPRNPAWVVFPVIIAPWLSILIAGFFLIRIAGVRLFTACYAVVNLYFTLAICLLAGMAISGSWL